MEIIIYENYLNTDLNLMSKCLYCLIIKYVFVYFNNTIQIHISYLHYQLQLFVRFLILQFV